MGFYQWEKKRSTHTGQMDQKKNTNKFPNLLYCPICPSPHSFSTYKSLVGFLFLYWLLVFPNPKSTWEMLPLSFNLRHVLLLLWIINSMPLPSYSESLISAFESKYLSSFSWVWIIFLTCCFWCLAELCGRWLYCIYFVEDACLGLEVFFTG